MDTHLKQHVGLAVWDVSPACWGELCSCWCRQGVFCALLEKISFFVNFLPYIFVVFFGLVYCSIVLAFVPHSWISFSFCPGIGDCGIFSAIAVRWSLNSVLWFSQTVSSATCSVMAMTQPVFLLHQELPLILKFEQKVWDFRNMLSCRASVWFWNNPGGTRYSGTVEGLPSQQVGLKSVTVRRGVFARSYRCMIKTHSFSVDKMVLKFHQQNCRYWIVPFCVPVKTSNQP